MTPEIQHQHKSLRLFDAVTLIMGSMIGSGIFIVSAAIASDVKTPGLLMLNWLAAGIITVCGALSYGELAAAYPHAGGQYVYLRELYNRLTGFLFGWATFSVIQTGTIAAVAMAFASYSGEFFPGISGSSALFTVAGFSFSTQQLLAMIVIVFLTLANFREVKSGARVQNLFTTLKVGALLFMVVAGLGWGLSTGKGSVTHFSESLPQTNHGIAIFSVFLAALVGSLFSADAWNNVTFLAGELKEPRRDLPKALLIGTGTVILLYLLVNVAYLYILPMDQIASSPDGRVATRMMSVILGSNGRLFMAGLVMVSTFGCLNGIILSGARVYYAMALDGLFIRPAAKLNRQGVPANSLILQGVWSCMLVLSGSYNALLDYVMFVVLLFYILSILGVFILRKKKPAEERPFRTPGYPVVPILYIVLAVAICISIAVTKTQAAVYGLGILAIGVPLYFFSKKPAETA